MRYYVIDDQGNQYGPADLATLQRWIGEGRLDPNTRLRDEMTNEIKLASQVPGLNFGATTVTSSPQDNYTYAQPNPTQPSAPIYADYYRSGGGAAPDVNAMPTLIASVVAFVACAGCLAIPAIVYSAMAMNSIRSGDLFTAQAQLRTAQSWLIGSVVVGVCCGGFWFLSSFVGAF